MRDAFRRIGLDLKNRRNVDAYVVAAMALVLAVLSVAGDVVSEQLRWAGLLAGVGLLVYRVTLPDSAKHGTIIVEFHAFHNEATSSRMHLEITRQGSERWYSYWSDQFDHIWRAAVPPAPAGDETTAGRAAESTTTREAK